MGNRRIVTCLGMMGSPDHRGEVEAGVSPGARRGKGARLGAFRQGVRERQRLGPGGARRAGSSIRCRL